MRRAWIEINRRCCDCRCCDWSLSMRRAWIEMHCRLFRLLCRLSLSMRRAWIEIYSWLHGGNINQVALHAESVDRNFSKISFRFVCPVALHAESVDRNAAVALHQPQIIVSLSMRRAWIEICNLAVATHNICCRSPCGERG